MAAFDLLIRGGTVADGSGTPGRRADVGVFGDRIVAVGDLSAAATGGVELILDATGRVVSPGFIDPHGHSDGSVLLDGAPASHLHQGFTTQLSGNRGESLAPVTDARRSLGELAADLDRDPAELAFDALVDDRLDVSIVIQCMDAADVATIAAVPWIAVCTDAEGRRPGHPILDSGRPHPRTYGTTARFLGTYVRELRTLALETAVAKLTSVSAARLGLRPRGIIRDGAFADLVVFDPATVRDEASYAQPVRHPSGIDHVIVNGRPAILSGSETGERPGRLLRRQ